jgi:hypothetical protein
MTETPRLEVVQVGTGDNRFSMRVESELLDRMQVMREINVRMTKAFLDAHDTAVEEVLGDLDNWRPVGLLTRGALPAPIRVLGPPPGFVESPVWTPLWEEAARQWASAEFEVSRDERNARAVEWWRSQRA